MSGEQLQCAGAGPTAGGDASVSATSIARRSISIFSRKGSNEDSPKVVSIASAAGLPARSSRWNGKRTSMVSISRSSDRVDRRASKGTILKAVPPAKVIEMTPLEEMMATSPNEEILSAISSEHPPHHDFFAGTSPFPLKPRASRRSGSSGLNKASTRSGRGSDDEHRIGTWIDGIAHFDETAASNRRSLHIADLDISRSQKRETITIQFPDIVKITSTPILAQPVPRRMISASALPAHLRPSPSTTPEHGLGSPKPANHRSHPSQSSCSSKTATEESSVYSRSSSVTTIDEMPPAAQRTLVSPSKFSLVSPTQAGVLDDSSSRSSGSWAAGVDVNKALPPTPARSPVPPPLRIASSPSPPLSKSLSILRERRPVKERMPQRHSVADLRLSRLSWCHSSSHSPTLSQAELEVRNQLSEMTKVKSRPRVVKEAPAPAARTSLAPPLSPALQRRNSVKAVMQPPAIPKRSRKREWRAPAAKASWANSPVVPARRRSFTSLPPPAKIRNDLPIRRMASLSHKAISTEPMVALPKLSNSRATVVVESFAAEIVAPFTFESSEDEQFPSHDQAEAVLLNILCALSSLRDLANTAIINKGMYRVYKQHELHLVQAVIENTSTPAHELQQWRQLQETAASPVEAAPVRPLPTACKYLAQYQSDLDVIRELKTLVSEKCQTFIRRETTFALSTPTHPNSQRFDDALWRIWCFCHIFGSRKGREDDITGQLDWLKGGLLHEHEGCAATVNTNLEIEMSSVLLNAPEHFATANRGGLTAAQLYDMTEMWTCLLSLLQGYSGRVDQARYHGVYDNCDVAPGDVHEEERFLEEWLAHILTLGPAVVLDLARLASDPSPAGFEWAQKNGWTEWSLPVYNSSLSNFLKEPVAILYSEQIAAAKHRHMDPREQERKEMSRKRVASMAAEIRLRRQTSDYKRLPLIDMDGERPMSIFSRMSSVSTPVRNPTAATYSTAAPPPTLTTRRFGNHLSTDPPAHHLRLTIPRPLLSPCSSDKSRQDSPRSRLPDAGLDSCDKAVMQLVSMGFPVTQVKEALKVTDDGGSLRVDRALEFLLRQ